MKITTTEGTYPTYPILKIETPMVGAVFRPYMAFKREIAKGRPVSGLPCPISFHSLKLTERTVLPDMTMNESFTVLYRADVVICDFRYPLQLWVDWGNYYSAGKSKVTLQIHRTAMPTEETQ